MAGAVAGPLTRTFRSRDIAGPIGILSKAALLLARPFYTGGAFFDLRHQNGSLTIL
jgi:hypothetical protein